ncbi:hypothetical protein GOQ29_05005 [Clostridium sp. D2Q-14]|uniref:hypothetical protein n=1 Tax=Anaeromonas gelatinilytica TaxID=2683194 RepID=UPI00193B49E0|nr:hypothetical protein [Anaeromonas gelatinilytica]MBS4534975.1 hypothetical protein [Anaeromonas gelatinilytica]
MARAYDIVNRIKTGNEKSKVKIDEEHEYTINTTKSAVLHIKAISEDESLDDMKRMDKIISIGLGNKAAKYIDSLDMPFANYVLIVNVIMAAISDEELEEVEKTAKEVAKTGKK